MWQQIRIFHLPVVFIQAPRVGGLICPVGVFEDMNRPLPVDFFVQICFYYVPDMSLWQTDGFCDGLLAGGFYLEVKRSIFKITVFEAFIGG